MPPAYSQDSQPDIVKRSKILLTGDTVLISMDTLITGSQNNHPQYKRFPSWSELGNIGLPAIQNRFLGIGSTSNPIFLKPYLTYLEEPDQLFFYNTNLPFSQIGYNTGGANDKNGQNLSFIYTRNFGGDVNIAGLFDFVSSTGHYKNQAAVESTLGLRFVIDKKRYKHFSSIERVQFKLQENGGVKDDALAVSTPSGDAAVVVGVNLEAASSVTSIIRLRGVQYINIFSGKTPKLTDSTSIEKVRKTDGPVLVHRYNYTTARRIYNDKPGNLSFYKDTLISSVITYDSVQHFGFENDINLRFNNTLSDSSTWIAEAGIHHELIHFYSYDNSDWKQKIGFGGLTELNLTNFNFRIYGEFIFAGYGAGDHEVELSVRRNQAKKPGGPELKILSRTSSPDLFSKRYMGNNFQWENNFSRQGQKGFDFTWKIPEWKLILQAKSSIVSNFIYFDKSAKPAQMDNTALLAEAGINKSFMAGPLRSNNSVFVNYTNVDEIPLPLIVAASSTFMHHDIHFTKTKGLLQIEYGFDVRYTSSYKGYAYMPATGIFYLQDERLLGNYPFMDLFLIMRVKRTRFFVKWDHVNSGFTGDNIFTVLHYPVKQRYIKYGLFWHFHD